MAESTQTHNLKSYAASVNWSYSTFRRFFKTLKETDKEVETAFSGSNRVLTASQLRLLDKHFK